LLTKFDGVKQYFVAPEEFQMGSDILELLEKAGSSYEVVEDFVSVIPEVDAIYMTRLQDEWDKEEGVTRVIDSARFSFGPQHLDLLSPMRC
jgi:aspartate carbamoyltransferase catalytic subunit